MSAAAGSIEVNRAAIDLIEGKLSIWTRPPSASSSERRPEHSITLQDVADAKSRVERFRPALQALFPRVGWDGRIRSPLRTYPLSDSAPVVLVKADSELPVTGSVKARGGVYELLCYIERIADELRLLGVADDYANFAAPAAQRALSRFTVSVASTGNLGYSIGVVARAFGLNAVVHMSHDAKSWKKQRLRALDVEVVEHECDYTETVARGRYAAAQQDHHFIDDEGSRQLLIGYALGAEELIEQLGARGIFPTRDAPVVVYLPCGVGGAPGGITFGLKAHLGECVHCVFVEPTSAACVFAAMAAGGEKPISVYDIGLRNNTIADGLAVPTASQLVLDIVGASIDAVVALPDHEMITWMKRAWREAGLRLEPSAAAALAAIKPFIRVRSDLREATHVAWLTGGSMLPDEEFAALIDSPSAVR